MSAVLKTVAAVVEQPKGPFVLREVELEAPRPDEVRVRLHAVGICHTDLVHRDGHGAFGLPAVLGHEGAGIIEAVGEQVSRVSVGERVVLSFHACRQCAACRNARPAYCAEAFAGNFSGARPDGSRPVRLEGREVGSAFFGQSSFARHAIVAARNVVKVPDDLSLERLAPLGCGLQTGAGAVLNTLQLKAGQSLAVFGAGAVGLAAIMAAKAVGAGPILAIDIRDERLALAEQLGADMTFRGDQPDLAKAVRRAVKGGVEAALDCVGAQGVLASAFQSLAVGGTCVLLGLPRRGTEVGVDMTALLQGRRLVGSIEGDADPQSFIPHLIDLHRQGRFPFEQLIRFYPFEAINEAVHDMEQGRTIKPVLLMPQEQTL
ncbi:MAG: NAD(P)-dependent alcohol dehydrogenase [Janthinobacterium lividum]